MAKKKRKTNNKLSKPRRKSAQAPANAVAPVLASGLQLGLLVLCCVVAYAITLDVPFYLDDFSSIRENLAIRDLGNLDAIIGFSPLRAVSYISFAANYAVHEYNLAGYHLVNLVIHFVASVLAFLLAMELMKISRSEETNPALTRLFPLLVALLFALHPLQTQAVTYIVQRSASMTALFYLATLYLYLRGRLTTDFCLRLLFYGLAFLLAVLAFFTKQNSVSLPLAVLLIEVVFFRLQRGLLVKGAILCLGLGLLGLILLFLTGNTGLFDTLSEATQETDLVSRGEYLAIQMGVIWTYIAKFFFPYPLHLEYDIAVRSFADPVVQLFTVMHIAVLGFALWNIRRRPLLAFGILFYYIAHSVESSIIPIRNFAFEHRTYLPNFGLCLVAAYAALTLLPSYLDSRKVLAVIALVLVTLFSLTLARNNLWRDPIAFYQHEIEVSPNALRPRNSLGEAYIRADEIEEAAEVYENGLQIIDTSFDRQNNSYIAYQQNYALVLGRLGEYERALNLLNDQSLDGLSPADRSSYLTVRGNIYATQLQVEPAEADFTEALALDRNNANALLSLGKVLYMQARLDEARATFDRYFEVDPTHPYRHEAEQVLALMDELERTGELNSTNQRQ